MNVDKIACPLSIQVETTSRCRGIIEYRAVHNDFSSWSTYSGLCSLNVSLLIILFKIAITVYCKEILVLNVQQTFVRFDCLKCKTVIFYVLVDIIFRCRLILNCVEASGRAWSDSSGWSITIWRQSNELISLCRVSVLHFSQCQICPRILTRKISSTHDVASWNAFSKVHTCNDWFFLADWKWVWIQNCCSLRRRRSFRSWLLVVSVVVDEVLVVLHRLESYLGNLKVNYVRNRLRLKVAVASRWIRSISLRLSPVLIRW